MDTTLPMLKELESTVLVRFQDCDPYGHLNNARYVDYFMNARLDQVAQFYDFHIFDLIGQANENWVVTKSQIAYLLPTPFNEQVLIRTRLVHLTARTLVVEGLMLDPEARHLKAVAWIEFIYVSLATGRPAKHGEDLMRFFESIRFDGGYEADGFNSRVQALRTEVRGLRQTTI